MDRRLVLAPFPRQVSWISWGVGGKERRKTNALQTEANVTRDGSKIDPGGGNRDACSVRRQRTGSHERPALFACNPSRQRDKAIVV